MVGFGAVFSINKMYQYSISYEKGSGDYHKGLITAGVSGFAKGSIYGLGKSVLTLTSVITALNPVFVTGALIFDSLAYTASNFLEVGVEEACYEILDYNNEDKNEVKERRRDSLTKAFIKSKNASGFKILENISPFSFDAFAQRSLNELEYQQYIRNKINSRVDHTTNWLENDRKNSQ